METTVKEYKSMGEYQADAAKRAREGWSVQSTMEKTQRTGCMRFIMLGGIGALVFHPRPHILVTYVRNRG